MLEVHCMEEISASRSPPQPAAGAAEDSGRTVTSSTNATTMKRQEGSSSVLSRAKRDCASFTISLQEGLRHVKALILGQAKKLTAGNEKEATEADMITYKMQVDAADAAEDAKKKLNKTA